MSLEEYRTQRGVCCAGRVEKACAKADMGRHVRRRGRKGARHAGPFARAAHARTTVRRCEIGAWTRAERLSTAYPPAARTIAEPLRDGPIPARQVVDGAGWRNISSFCSDLSEL